MLLVDVVDIRNSSSVNSFKTMLKRFNFCLLLISDTLRSHRRMHRMLSILVCTAPLNRTVLRGARVRNIRDIIKRLTLR